MKMFVMFEIIVISGLVTLALGNIGYKDCSQAFLDSKKNVLYSSHSCPGALSLPEHQDILKSLNNKITYPVYWSLSRPKWKKI